jgi:hypothetical protein
MARSLGLARHAGSAVVALDPRGMSGTWRGCGAEHRCAHPVPRWLPLLMVLTNTQLTLRARCTQSYSATTNPDPGNSSCKGQLKVADHASQKNDSAPRARAGHWLDTPQNVYSCGSEARAELECPHLGWRTLHATRDFVKATRSPSVTLGAYLQQQAMPQCRRPRQIPSANDCRVHKATGKLLHRKSTSARPPDGTSDAAFKEGYVVRTSRLSSTGLLVDAAATGRSSAGWSGAGICKRLAGTCRRLAVKMSAYAAARRLRNRRWLRFAAHSAVTLPATLSALVAANERGLSVTAPAGEACTSATGAGATAVAASIVDRAVLRPAAADGCAASTGSGSTAATRVELRHSNSSLPMLVPCRDPRVPASRLLARHWFLEAEIESALTCDTKTLW